MQKQSAVSTHLDLIRGVAALEVFLGHVRQHTIADFQPSYSLPVKLLYFLTGFGNESLMVFFVLSGYFVAGSVLSDHRRGRWSWGRYLVNRGSRLYTVLIPALLIGACWDLLGVRLLGLPETDSLGLVAPRMTWLTGLGNLFFLQGFLVRPFGSNSPLWSLSLEAWYYILFPLLVGAFWSKVKPLARLGQLALFGLILWFIGGQTAYFLLWMFGAALAFLPPPPRWGGWLAFGVGTVLLLGLLGALGTSRFHYGLVADTLVAGSFTIFVYGLIGLETPAPAPALYARSSAWLSGFSYTLYLVHFPPLLFIQFALLLRTHQSTFPDARGLGVWFAISAVLFVYAYLISLVTEARTDVLRRWLTSRLPTPKTATLSRNGCLAGRHQGGLARGWPADKAATGRQKAPRKLRRPRDPDPRVLHEGEGRGGRVGGVKGAGRVAAEIRAVKGGGNAQRPGQLARPRAEPPRFLELATLLHLRQPRARLERPDEHKSSPVRPLGQHVEQPVNAVVEVDVGGPRGVRLHEGLGAATEEGVAGLVPLGRVGLGLHDDPAGLAPDQARADQLCRADQRGTGEEITGQHAPAYGPWSPGQTSDRRPGCAPLHRRRGPVVARPWRARRGLGRP
jgi:peptidoglycan/LPS O-acetylase OafA/YrhL